MARSARLVVVAAVVALALAGCGGSGQAGTSSSAGPSGTGGAGQVSGEITVFAAASLTEAFTEVGRRFEADHPGTTVRFNFGPSSGLATQITQGAPADVFASASTTTMRTVLDSGDAATSSVFAVNTMMVATPIHQSVPVTSLSDLARPGVKVAVCAADVPCGVAADALFARNALAVRPVTREVDVKAVLSKVQLGEVDAGIVYVTDVEGAAGAVVGVPIPAAENVTTDYPIATVAGSRNPAAARAFVDLVLSAVGRGVLATSGFGAP